MIATLIATLKVGAIVFVLSVFGGCIAMSNLIDAHPELVGRQTTTTEALQ